MKAVAEQKESETVLKILLYFLKILLGNETFKVLLSNDMVERSVLIYLTKQLQILFLNVQKVFQF